jgi:nitrite reductase (NADH) small subunit
VRPVKAGGARLAVGRAGEELFAVEGICPHAGAVLGEGLVDGYTLVCPMHAYGFDVRTGACGEDESLRLRRYPTRVVAGRLEVQIAAITRSSSTGGSPG